MEDNTSDVQRKVDEFWSKHDNTDTGRGFYAFPPIKRRSCKLLFDELDASRRDWCEYWTVEKYLKNEMPFKKCLSICCGFGIVERILSRLNVAEKIVGTDLASGAVEQAKIRAKEEGLNNIEYFVSDINTVIIPENEYDIIWANGALHHIKELNTVIPKLHRALRNGGYLIANEYVGPNYQQLSLRQQELINAVRHLLPDDLVIKTDLASWGRPFLSRAIRKVDKILFPPSSDSGTAYAKIWNMPDVDFFLKNDPSESVDSSNVIPTLQKHFSNVNVKYFDGSIIFYALDNKFYDNFDVKNPNHRRVLDLLFNIEDNFIASGEIGRDNAHIICKK